MTSADPELSRLLIQELERHVVALEGDPRDPGSAQRSVHALRGSAGLAGERELAAALERIGRRIREGDTGAFVEAAALVRGAIARLQAGEPAVEAQWPVPPDDLAVRPLDPTVRAQYSAEVADRLARIDDSLATGEDPIEAARTVYRHVHTMKGAASSVGDEPMSWFCHGLEERLRVADSRETARTAMQEVAHWRVVLGALLDEPETALQTLRARRRPSSPMKGLATAAPHGGSHLSALDSDPPRATGFDEATATIRVPAHDIDRLIERLDVIERARERIGTRVERGQRAAVSIRRHRSSLIEALRLIGPPRPWGAPAAALRRLESVGAALGVLADEFDAAATRLSTIDHVLREGVTDAKKQLSAMRQTTVGRIFGRLTTAIESEARRGGCAVIVRTRGADETIDRSIAEHLIEPCLQLVRNAVAHGIESPELRTSIGKPASGTIALTARKVGNRLSLTIEDDGAGVDVTDVRARAVTAGLVTPGIAEAADDDTLLSLLFLPGFSTRETSDLLAGRGIGLEIARSSVQRMGGAIRLSSRAGEGFCARIDVPIDTGLVTMLWVMAGGEEYALPAANAHRVRLNDAPEGVRSPHLRACLDGSSSERSRYLIDLDLHDETDTEPPAIVGVDSVGHAEEVLVRPLGPLVSGLGPFAGVIVRGDGSLRFAIDAWALAPRARAFSRTASSGGSLAPTSARG
ncbi:MAG TPA: Hpt domain-containing protein [Polyangiaceae bacterium]|jgi:two-component system chemotaxis sensor kinase CheA|nr:Hpt domain-containing protein [Polyangiaceae bacterium]